MKSLRKRRITVGISQRSLAALADASYKTIQLLESGPHDTKLSTLRRIAKSLGYPPEIVDRTLASVFEQPPDSILVISERILLGGEWKMWLFEFVDAFRAQPDPSYIDAPPVKGLSEKISALLASTVETLCEELGVGAPAWCKTIPLLKRPWFVSDMESLKASALLESPIHFRKRNIFVLENFLSRR